MSADNSSDETQAFFTNLIITFFLKMKSLSSVHTLEHATYMCRPQCTSVNTPPVNVAPCAMYVVCNHI